MNAGALRRAVLRALAVVLCLVALTDPRPVGGSSDAFPVAVIDVSKSVGAGPPRVHADLRLRTRWIVVADGVQVVVGSAEAPRLGRAATRLGEALRRAAELHPGADVLLLTDGRDTEGDALAGARRVAAAGGRVFVAPPLDPAADVALLSARLLEGGQSPIIRAEVVSSTSGQAEIRLSRDGRIVDRRPIGLTPGGAPLAIELRDPIPPGDGAGYLVTLVPLPGTPDDDPGNNRLAVGLRPEKRVILTWGVAEALLGIAKPQDVVLRSVRDLEDGQLEGVDCLVLANVPWREMGTRLARSLERFVAGGGRLFVLGGPDAYAGGGWAGTRFEERLLPLRVPPEDETGLALVLALDRSGSTAGTALDHLKDATRRAVGGVTPGERIAVLPFAARPGELLPPGTLSHGDEAGRRVLLDALDALDAHGDTDLVAAAREAARRASGIEARERRVILLTDGDPDDPPDEAALAALASELQGRNVQIGALVVGDREAADRLRRTLARRPADVLLLRDADALPLRLLHQIGDLRDERMRLGRPSGFRPVGTAYLPFESRGFRPSGIHRLEVATEQGARARALARYDKPAETQPTVPFAATRSVGAGEVVAVAWGPELEDAAGRTASLAVFVPWIEQMASSADRGLAGEIEGNTLVVRHPAMAGRGALLARAAGTTQLVEVGFGLFRGSLPAGADEGVRVAPLDVPDSARPVRLPSRPPPEQRGAGLDEDAMRAIAAAGGGRRLASGEQPPAARTQSGPHLAPWLLLLACILLVIERAGTKPDGEMTDLNVSETP